MDDMISKRSNHPTEIKGWSWGACLIPPLWGIGNNTKLGLLVFVPILGLAIPFYLGYKGRSLAWRNKAWDSVASLQKSEKMWGYAGFGLWLGVIGLIAVIYCSIILAFHNSKPYKMAMNQVAQHPKVMTLLGAPIKANFAAKGNISVHNTQGHAVMKVPIYGPSGHAFMYVRAQKDNGQWALYRLIVYKKGHRINLVHPDI